MNWDSFPHSPAAGCCSSAGGVRELQARPARYPSPWMRLLSVIYRPGLLLSHRTQEEEEATLGPRPLVDKMEGEAEQEALGLLAWARGLLGWVYPWPQVAPSPSRDRGPPQPSSCCRHHHHHHHPPSTHHSPEPDCGYCSLEEEQAVSRQRLGAHRIDPGQIAVGKEAAAAGLLLLQHPADSTVTQSDRSWSEDWRSNSSSNDNSCNSSSNNSNSCNSSSNISCSSSNNNRSGNSSNSSNNSSIRNNSNGSSNSSNNSSSVDDETEGDSPAMESWQPLPRPQCSNRTIAYILGSNPSSESEDSDCEDSDWGDDGFSSDASSELSDAGQAAKLWHSLAAGSSDPYNPLNFQACLETTQRKPGPGEAAEPACHRLEDDEDRLDSGFSDTLQDELQKTFTQLASERQPRKKVAFDEHVTEYYVSSEEIRKGPWEEYARDRCRFQKRIRETEEDIGYCFSLEHRWTVLERMRLGS